MQTFPPPATPLVFIKRPLLRLWSVAEILDCPLDEVRAMIDDGRLAFAFDVSGKGSTQRDIRVLTASLVEFLSGTKPALKTEEDFQRVIKLIFPAVSQTRGVATVRATSIIRRFSVSSTHVGNLIDDGLLRPIKGSVRRTGPLGSPDIEFASVVEFLRKRRLT